MKNKLAHYSLRFLALLLVAGFLAAPAQAMVGGDNRSRGEDNSERRAAAEARKKEIADARKRKQKEAAERVRIAKAAEVKLEALKKETANSESQLRDHIDKEFSEVKEDWNRQVEAIESQVVIDSLLEVIRDEIKDTVKNEINRRIPNCGASSRNDQEGRGVRLAANAASRSPASSYASYQPQLPQKTDILNQFYAESKAALAEIKSERVKVSLIEASTRFRSEWIARSSTLMNKIAANPKIRETVQSMQSYIENSVAAAAQQI